MIGSPNLPLRPPVRFGTGLSTESSGAVHDDRAHALAPRQRTFDPALLKATLPSQPSSPTSISAQAMVGERKLGETPSLARPNSTREAIPPG